MTLLPRRVIGPDGRISLPRRRVQIRADGSATPERVPVPVPSMQGTPTYPLPNFFPIGVWVQPVNLHQRWIDRGVNTLVAIPEANPHAEWVDSANRLGLWQIRHPRNDISLRQDAANPWLKAWMHPDEPYLSGTVRHTPEELIEERRAMYEAAPHMPCLLNHSGGDIRHAFQASTTTDLYRAYMNSSDWVGQDLYPVTGWAQPDWHDHRYHKPTENTRVNDVMRAVMAADHAPNKPIFNFIECADQRLNWVPAGSNPTPAQQSAHVWDAIINGVRGIVYFPVAFHPFTSDNMDAGQVAQMVADNALIKSLEPWLLGHRLYVPLDVPFQRAVFTRADGTTKTMTINQSNETATLDAYTYGPYELVVT